MTEQTETARTGRSGRGRRRRRALFWVRAAAALLVVAVLGLWAVLESAPAAERLRVLLETRGSATLGAPVRIGSLEMDALPFHLELRDVWVGDPTDEPLAQVDRLALDLSPLALLQQRISILGLELDRPRVRLDLPFDTSGEGESGPLQLEIRRLRVRDGTLVFAHRTARFSGELEGIFLSLAPEREGFFVGPFATGVGQLRVADGRLDLTERAGPDAVLEPVQIDATFGLERSELTFDRLRLGAGSSRIEASGPIHDMDSLELEVEADAALDDIFKLWQPPGPDDHGGRATFRGTFQLRDGTPLLAGRISTDGARLSGLPLDSFVGDLQLRPELTLVRDVRAELLDGTFTGSLEVDPAVTPSRITLRYEIDSVDAAALTRWSVLDGWRVAGQLDATGELVWAGDFSETATGSGRIRLDLPHAATVELARRLADAFGPDTAVRDGEAPARQGHAAPALPLPVDADIRWRLGAGTVSLQDTTIRLPATDLTVNGRIDLDGEILGTVRLDSSDLRMVDHMVTQYRQVQGARDAERLGIRGAATARLDLRGTTGAPVVTGQIDARALGVRDLSIGQLTAGLQPQPGLLLLDPLRITRQGGTAVGSARLRIPGGVDAAPPDYDVRLQLDEYDLAVEPEVADRQLPVDATLVGSLRLQGDYEGTPTADFDLVATNAAVRGVRLERVAARGRATGELVSLDDVAVVGLGGTVDGSASWRPGERRLEADLELTGMDMTAVSDTLDLGERLAGSVDGSLRVSGPVDRIDGQAELTWTEAGVAGLPLGTVVAAARAEDGVVAARALGHPAGGGDLAPPAVPRTTTPGSAPTVLPAPEDGWSMAATVGTHAPYPAAVRVSSEAGVVAGLLQRLGQPLPPDATFTGQLDARGRGNLTDLGAWHATATISGFRVQQPPAFSLASEQVQAELAGGRITAEAILQSDAGPFDVSLSADLRGGALDGHLQGTVAAAALRLWDEDLVVDGTARVSLQLAGTTADPVVTGDVAVRGFGIDQGWLYPVASTEADLELRGDVLRVTRLEGTVGGEPFTVTGTLPLAALLQDESQPEVRSRLELSIQRLPVGPVVQRSEALSSLISGGTISGRVHLEGRGLDPSAFTGSVDVDGFEIEMRDYDWSMTGATDATLRDGRIILPEGTRITGTRTDFALTGTIDLAPLRLDLSVDGRVGLEPLNVLSPVWGTGGSAVADLRVYGPVEDLQFEGTAQLQQVVLSPPPLRQPIEDITARVEMQERRVRVTDFEGELGGGAVTGSGELFLRDNAPQSFRFAFQADNALVRLERQVQVRASADVVLDGAPDRALLSGSVRLLEGRYRRDLEADDAILELLEAPETDPDPLLAAVHLDLQVVGDRGLHIDNNLAEVDVTADFDVRGTLAQPVMLGRSVILDGELYWNDLDFEVLRGTVEFNNPFETEPFFEIRARTDVRRYTVNLNLSGSFQRGFAVDYTSTPTLSDLDLFNLLAFGEEPDSEVFQDPYRYQRALGLQATRYLTEAYLSEVERGAERIFGVDRFRIAPTLTGSETDATARLTIGKRLSSNLYVTYSRLLSNSEDQLLTVEYQLSPTTRLKGTRDEDGSFGIDFLVQKRIR